MREWRARTTALLLGSTLLVGLSLIPSQADAAPTKPTAQHAAAPNTTKTAAKSTPFAQNGRTGMVRETPMSLYKARVMAHRGGGTRAGMTVARYGGMSCVPYARMATGISVSGNAWQWWDNSAGTYARGKMPEAGSILSFRANHSMRMGHVAVVSRVVNARQVLIDHANWPTSGGRGGVARGVAVVDVSESNDWSAVRVQLGRGDDFGSVYPTHGFIYDRPDSGYMRTAVAIPAPQQSLNPAPRDLRPASERMWSSYDEVAEAPMSYGRARTTTYATHATPPKQRNTARRP